LIEFNIDVGETDDESVAFYDAATTVNIACGGHAGDAASMDHAARLALSRNVRIFAHPSYPDREGFGRRGRHCSHIDAARSVKAQCDLLQEVVTELGAIVVGLKLHGALYHDANDDPALAALSIDHAISALPEIRFISGPPDGALRDAAFARGIGFEREGFADRGYDDAHKLIPRSHPKALLTDEQSCVTQALRFARDGLYDTLCMHGDSPGAARLAMAVGDALRKEGFLEGSPKH
jgi:5-oxoprolinase (ATP-hydrolysing) subunit A